MKRKLAALLLGLIIAVSTSACGGAENVSGTAEESTQKEDTQFDKDKAKKDKTEKDKKEEKAGEEQGTPASSIRLDEIYKYFKDTYGFEDSESPTPERETASLTNEKGHSIMSILKDADADELIKEYLSEFNIKESELKDGGNGTSYYCGRLSFDENQYDGYMVCFVDSGHYLTLMSSIREVAEDAARLAGEDPEKAFGEVTEEEIAAEEYYKEREEAKKGEKKAKVDEKPMFSIVDIEAYPYKSGIFSAEADKKAVSDMTAYLDETIKDKKSLDETSYGNIMFGTESFRMLEPGEEAELEGGAYCPDIEYFAGVRVKVKNDTKEKKMTTDSTVVSYN
jgi:hypothetical protein